MGMTHHTNGYASAEVCRTWWLNSPSRDDMACANAMDVTPCALPAIKHARCLVEAEMRSDWGSGSEACAAGVDQTICP